MEKKPCKGKTVCSRNRKEQGEIKGSKSTASDGEMPSAVENCSKEGGEVFHDRLRLTTTDNSCQVPQNRRERAAGKNLPFGEGMAKHSSSKRKDVASKT